MSARSHCLFVHARPQTLSLPLQRRHFDPRAARMQMLHRADDGTESKRKGQRGPANKHQKRNGHLIGTLFAWEISPNLCPWPQSFNGSCGELRFLWCSHGGQSRKFVVARMTAISNQLCCNLHSDICEHFNSLWPASLNSHKVSSNSVPADFN